MFLATSVDLMPKSLSRAATCALRISPMFTSAMRRFPCASRSTSCSADEIVGIHVEHDAFGDHRHAVAPAVAQSLDDGADQRVDNRLQPDSGLGNSSGMSVSVAPAALPIPSARCPPCGPS